MNNSQAHTSIFDTLLAQEEEVVTPQAEAVVETTTDEEEAVVTLQEAVESLNKAVSKAPKKKGSQRNKPGTKKAIAVEIFQEYDEPSANRKEIIQRFINEAGLTEKGAPTYYRNIKQELSK